MILTITPNPALDYTLWLDELVVGKRAKYRNPTIEPSGKGINVSRMAKRLGEPTLALSFAAGPTGDLLRLGLDRESVPYDLIPAPGLTRINVTLMTGEEGSATHLHGPGGGVSATEVAELRTRLLRHAADAKVLVLSGSLPRGMLPGMTIDLLLEARRSGVRLIVDAEDALLATAIEARMDVVKPNALEAAEFLGREIRTVEDAAAAARELVDRGVGTAILTLRGAGAVAANSGRAWHVQPPREEVVRSIGAGDSFAAGLAVGFARWASLPDALKLAAAAGAATALHAGTGLGAAEEVARLLERTELRELS